MGGNRRHKYTQRGDSQDKMVYRCSPLWSCSEWSLLGCVWLRTSCSCSTPPQGPVGSSEPFCFLQLSVQTVHKQINPMDASDLSSWIKHCKTPRCSKSPISSILSLMACCSQRGKITPLDLGGVLGGRTTSSRRKSVSVHPEISGKSAAHSPRV